MDNLQFFLNDSYFTPMFHYRCLPASDPLSYTEAEDDGGTRS